MGGGGAGGAPSGLIFVSLSRKNASRLDETAAAAAATLCRLAADSVYNWCAYSGMHAHGWSLPEEGKLMALTLKTDSAHSPARQMSGGEDLSGAKI